MPGSLVTETNTSSKASLAEIAASLLKLESEKINVVPNTEAGKTNVLSDADLDILLDRSPAVFADRLKGWTSATVDAENGKKQKLIQEKQKTKAAFEVFESATDETNDTLAKLMGENDGEEE